MLAPTDEFARLRMALSVSDAASAGCSPISVRAHASDLTAFGGMAAQEGSLPATLSHRDFRGYLWRSFLTCRLLC